LGTIFGDEEEVPTSRFYSLRTSFILRRVE